MDNVLIVSGSEKGQQFLLELLDGMGFLQKSTALNGGEARRLFLEQSFELVVINTPLPDEFGHELALSCAEDTGVGVLMLVRAETADAVSQRVEDSGVCVLPKPVSRQMFCQSVKVLSTARNRILLLEKENVKLRQKLEEARVVSRAKCMLIEYRSLTEPQAHRHIEKQAMDLRLTRREVAEKLLREFDGF